VRNPKGAAGMLHTNKG